MWRRPQSERAAPLFVTGLEADKGSRPPVRNGNAKRNIRPQQGTRYFPCFLVIRGSSGVAASASAGD